MDIDKPMNRARRIARVGARYHTLANITAAVIGAVVLDLQSGYALLEFRRQRRIDGIHIDEIGVPALRRCLQRIEHAGLWRFLHIGHIGVPDGFAMTRLPIGSPFSSTLDTTYISGSPSTKRRPVSWTGASRDPQIGG